MAASPIDRWLPFRRSLAALPSQRLFCFPNAGGAASMFRRWMTGVMPANIEVCAIQLPGRESRMREKPFTRLEPLLGALVEVLKPVLDRPFAFFGHSMGTLVSFELAHRLAQAGAPTPSRLIVAGRRAPHLPDDEEPVHTLSDAKLIERLRNYGGTPAEILGHKELMKLVLPTIRADFEVIETFAYSQHEPLTMPIDVLGGHDDEDAPTEKLEAWSELTTAPCQVQMYPGGHFFLHEQPEPVLTAVRQLVSV